MLHIVVNHQCSNDAWSQVQLGPKCDGLGLRSLSLHAAAAAFIASLSFEIKLWQC